MDIKLVIIVAVELRDLIGFAEVVVRFVTLLLILSHRQERRLREIFLHPAK